MSGNTGHRGENEARHRLGGLVALLEARGILRSVLPGGGASIAGVAVGSVTHDSRRAAAGSLFVAVIGQNDDGHMYALAAVQAGAVAVIAERAIPGVAVPQLLVHTARPALALAAAWVHDFPSRELGVVGITGTDGKTTTAHLVRALLGACAGPTGMVGTIDVVVGGRSLGNTGRATTPEAPELQAHLAGMVAAGDRFAVVEATSHGLAQDRAAEIDWDVAVLTNIGHEHLEFHRTHEAYRAAKRRLFESLARPSGSDVGGKGVTTAVVNRDDAAADEFLDAARAAGAKLLTYGTDPRGSADIRATSVHEDATGLTIAVATPTWRDTVALPLAGRFNVHNALAAIGVAEAFGIDPACIRAALAAVEPVPGRMERIDQGQPFVVIVDYAHTPEALETVLDGLAPLAAASGGGLIAVFGSAGDRDVMKRPMMGRIAGERCRLVVITDEDPRSEDRDAILEAIADGAEAVGRRRDQDLLLIADRDAAIHRAIELARPGDVVVLCGKGHERSIEMRDGPVPWDEAEVARSALAAAGHVGRALSGRD
ncbi:MAG: UDP-N-acetylmuramoyl-L-alanyl-D-glutamate--2,6-diaminopimelate ligase [Chloroflexi bacterium]|nr:UDP-N-acetylmuramoyl-L-alanyl-D-glutamate--2,6-diaminopimelate ligase [Chloroflexota bacterium]